MASEDRTAVQRRAKVTATFYKRDWRWLWVRKRTVEVELFRGYVEEWERTNPILTSSKLDPERSALEVLREIAGEECVE